MEDSKKIIEWWHKDSGKQARIRRRRIIKFSIIGVAALLVLILGIYWFTDFLARPVKDINSASVAGNWAMFGRDLTHSSSFQTTGVSLQGKVAALLKSGETMHSSPVIADGRIYVGSRNGMLYALDRASGQKVWEFGTGSWVESSPAVVGEAVYFGSNDGYLYAVNARTGEKLWDFSARYPIKSSPAFADGKIYFGCDDYYIYAVNASNGRLVWKVATGDTVMSSPVVANGIVYAGSMDGQLYAIDARSGRVRLKFPTNRPIISSPVVVDSTVYFNTTNGVLYAVDGNAKNWLWEHKIRPNWQVLYLYGAAPAPPPASGFLWTLRLEGSSSSSPTIAGNKLYLGVSNKVVCVDIATQKKSWEFAGERLFSSPPVVVNNTVYAANENGHLYVIDAASGKLLQDIAIGGKISSLPAVTDGTVYISSEDGNLYTVN